MANNSESHKFTLRSQSDCVKIMEHVVNGMADGTMTRSQADPINTSLKQLSSLLRIRQRYQEMFIEIHRDKIRNGEMDMNEEKSQLPSFFDNLS